MSTAIASHSGAVAPASTPAVPAAAAARAFCPGEVHRQAVTVSADYILGDEIGEGAYARVVAAKHLETGEKRAIKIVDKSCRRAVPADCAESEVLSMIDHPNAVKLYEIVETACEVNYVLEMMDADLYSLLYKRRSVDEATVRDIAASLTGCLAYLHDLDVVHRDLKLENILVNFTSNTVKLADFGYAKIATDANRPVGTTFYQSLETLVAQSQHGTLSAAQAKASDMYALGVMLFYLLIGRPPFYVQPPGDRRKFVNLIKASVADDDTRWPKDVTSSCKQFIIALLNPDCTARMTAEDAGRHPWLTAVASDKHTRAAASPMFASPLVQCPA